MSNQRRTYHQSPDQFRKYAHQVVDWIADYWGKVDSLPVVTKSQPGDTLKALPESAPSEGVDFDEILGDLDSTIMLAVNHWQSPNFFGYFASNVSGPSLIGDMVAAAMVSPNFQWACNPAATELEMRVVDWVADMLGLPASFKLNGAGGGVIQDTASVSTLCAIVAARQKAGGENSRLTAYITAETHSHVEKDLRVAGFDDSQVRKVRVNSDLSMDVDKLASMLADDLSAGRQPFFVVATIGTTSTTAVDDVLAIGKLCRKYGAWLHVDAAMAGAAAICPEFRGQFAGIELADSFVFNPHKWMFTNLHCSLFYVADKKPLNEALSLTPEYMRNPVSDSDDAPVVDYRDWTVSLGRSFRALKLWFVIRHYGVKGLQFHIRRHVELAQKFADWVKEDERFELAAPLTFNLVCLYHRDGDKATQHILQRINQSGSAMITHTRVAGRFVLRVHISQAHTELEHITNLWRNIQKYAAEL